MFRTEISCMLYLLSNSIVDTMMATLNIKANTEVLGFYQKQKSEFHFQEKTDNEFLMFLLDTAVRVISIGFYDCLVLK